MRTHTTTHCGTQVFVFCTYTYNYTYFVYNLSMYICIPITATMYMYTAHRARGIPSVLDMPSLHAILGYSLILRAPIRIAPEIYSIHCLYVQWITSSNGLPLAGHCRKRRHSTPSFYMLFLSVKCEGRRMTGIHFVAALVALCLGAPSQAAPLALGSQSEWPHYTTVLHVRSLTILSARSVCKSA